MRNLIFYCFLSLTACDYYTIQNDYREDIRAGYVIIKTGQCLEFFDLIFLGDFPLKFRYKDHQLMSDQLYKSGHYKVSKKADILKRRKPCDLDPVRKKENIDGKNTKTDDLEKEKEETSDEIQEETVKNPVKIIRLLLYKKTAQIRGKNVGT